MIPGRPSATAMVVAASVAREGACHGLPQESLDLARRALAAGSAGHRMIAALAGNAIGRRLLAGLEAMVMPGLARHHCRRKAWLWDRVRSHAQAGQRLLWVGVGFDGLGRALLSQKQGAQVIETDHPDTLARRHALVDGPGVTSLALALPGQHDALASLCRPGPTTLVCEGLLMYLPLPQVQAMLRLLADIPEPPRLLFTALDTTLTGGQGFRRRAPLVRRWLAWRGEPFLWRARPGSVRDLLAEVGYRCTDLWDGEDFGEYGIEAASV